MYKKIAFLVAALALIGLMVAPVVAQPYVHEFPQNFINHIMEDYNGVAAHGTIFEEDGTPTVAIILGERALPHDVVGATLLGFKIGTHLYYWRAPDVDGSLLGDRYARKVWIEDWSVVLDRYDLLTQTDPLDGGTETILFTNDTDAYEMIFCVDPDVNYWIAPQYMDTDDALWYMVGYHVSEEEMNTAKANGMVVLSETLMTLTGGSVERNDDLTYDFAPTVDYDAKTGADLGAAGDSITWENMGLQFSWPPTPQFLQLDVDYFVDWLGYTITLETILPTDNDADTINDHYIVEVVIKDSSGMVVDKFQTASAGAGIVDMDPTTYQRFWYGAKGPSLLKIEVDLDRDGETEAVLSYFYVEIWDVDYDNDLVRCQFFSSYFAPPIVFEGWSMDDLSTSKYNPTNIVASPLWGPNYADSSWAVPPQVVFMDQADLVSHWVYAEGIDTPDADGAPTTDYENAEDETTGGNDVAVIMDAVSPQAGQVVVGEFDYTHNDIPATYEKLTAFYIDWWGSYKFWYDAGVAVSPSNTSDGKIVGWTFYGEDSRPAAVDLGIDEPELAEEFIWIEANVTWPACTEWDLADLPEGNASGDMVFWGEVGCDEGPCAGDMDIFTFYLHSTDTFEKTDCHVITEDLYGYDWDGTDPKDLVPTLYEADVTLTEWWYNSTLHVYNVTGFHAGIYDSFNCLPGTTFTGTAHVDPVTGTISWGTGGADQYYEGEDVFSFIKTPLAYIDTQVFDGTTLSDDVIDKDLILVGGPHVNSIVDYLNDTGYLYLYYVVDRLFYPADVDPTTGEPNYYDLAYALGLTGMPWPEENIPRYTTGLGAIQFTAHWDGDLGPAASWDVDDSDPWGTEVGSVENWILVVAGTDRFGTYAASVALADPTKLIYETAPNFCNTSFVIVIGVTPYAVAPPVVPGVAPVVMVLVGTSPGVTPIGVGP